MILLYILCSQEMLPLHELYLEDFWRGSAWEAKSIGLGLNRTAKMNGMQNLKAQILESDGLDSALPSMCCVILHISLNLFMSWFP